MIKNKELIPTLVSVGLTLLMVGAAEITGEKELIFPEVSAIAIGALAAPSNSWNTDRLRLFVTIMAAAATGMLIVRTVPFGTVFQLPIGLAAVMILITVSQTDFIPAVSACVLPIILGTRSPSYMVTVAVMTLLILTAQFILEKKGLRTPQTYAPERPSAAKLRLRLAQVIIAGIICMAAVKSGKPFISAPPLIVAFAEMTSPNSAARKRMPTTAIMLSLSAFLGCSSRLLFTELLGLPMAFSAALTCCAVLFAVKRAELYFPPCGAIATLSFLIPSSSLLIFPFDITVGTLIFSSIAVLSSKHVEKAMSSVHKKQVAVTLTAQR